VKIRILLAVMALVSFPTVSFAQALPKPRVADLIRKVEDGVDAFRDYLDRRGETAREKPSTAGETAREKPSTAQGSRSRGSGSTANTEARKNQASDKKDELDDALGELNQSTNRLRRKFDATDKWMETKVEVERVVDDGRKINQHVARGKYGSEVARLWATLRANINDLARAYGVAPLGV
jgi:chromosome segregation ATPase